MFRHYKGGLYKILRIGTHTETNEKVVIYEDESGNVWVRPKEMFFGKVIVDGVEKLRFELLTESK